MMLDTDELLLFPPNLVAVVLLLVVVSHFLLREEHANNFRRLSLRFHPERLALSDGDDKKSREAAFAVIAEAFDVLSDPLKRAVYEQYGEEGLKRGVRGPVDKCIEPYVYHGQPLRTYKEFFGTENPYADLLDGVTGPLALQDCPGARGTRKKDEPVIKALPLTLNEVFHGGIKKMKIQRLVLHEGGGAGRDKEEMGTTKPEEKILSIPIMPGMPPGTRIVFPEEGDQGPTKIPADIIFVTEDKPHETFERDAGNPSTLRMTVKIFLSDALTGTIVTVHTLDDRILRVPITSVISPDYVKRISGEGLPLIDDPDRRGELVIDFNIEFPTHLTPASKGYVRKAFDTEDEVTDEEEAEDERLRRVLVGRRMYMRADKLSQICGP